MVNPSQVLFVIIVVIITAVISVYLTKIYIEYEIKNKLKGIYSGEITSLQDVPGFINEKLCGDIEYLLYPNWNGEGIGNNCFYNDILARFLLYLCENVGTTNCGIGDIPLPSIIDSGIPIEFLGHTYAYVFYCSSYRTTFLIWSGTSDAKMAEQDLSLFPVSMPDYITESEDIKVHKGFLNIYLNTRNQITKAYDNYRMGTDNFVIAGHSLGGALTTLSAFDIATNSQGISDVYPNIYAYTFASPRCGNIQFVDAYNNLDICSFRIFNTADIVPSLPPPAPDIHYTHVGREDNLLPFTINLGTNVDNHTTAYLKFYKTANE